MTSTLQQVAARLKKRMSQRDQWRKELNIAMMRRVRLNNALVELEEYIGRCQRALAAAEERAKRPHRLPYPKRSDTGGTLLEED